ncbi:MAG: LacI family DNA-binding transcriptional regulator [Terriglobales bacterium]
MQKGKAAFRHRTRGAAVPEKPIGLKGLADYLGLAPATVSLVMNDSHAANSIPAHTKERILAAARKFHYRPHFFARALRGRRSLTVGVLVPEISEGYTALVMSGIENYLLQAGYFYFVASHRHRPDLIEEYPRLLLERSVEGLILVDTPCRHHPPVPAVTVSGHQKITGLTNVVVNHRHAAAAALRHLFELGHRRIAYIKGQAFSADTEVRWKSIRAEGARLGLSFDQELVVQLEGDDPTPQLGYQTAQSLLARGRRFTALFAFNDISAIGAMRALREAGFRVPEDVSIVGFDDIQSASYQTPGLTTVRQPLRQMGEIAAETLLRRVANPRARYPHEIAVEPELVVRGSTAPVAERAERVVGSSAVAVGV